MSKRIVVIGAGPKGIAIAAKAAALNVSGYPHVPEVVLVEAAAIGAHWNGKHGYTNGRHRLGTPPEKDVGFPYLIEPFGPLVTREMLARYSWPSFCIHEWGMPYHEWVDRGKPHPRHFEWAAYLQWAAEAALETEAVVKLVRGKVTQLDIVGQRWKVQYEHQGSVSSIECDSVVVTGPGDSIRLHEQQDNPSILDGKSFWLQIDQAIFRKREDLPFVVVGAGETAASIVVELVERRRSELFPILVVNRNGTIFSRGEGYHENKLFTDPTDPTLEWRTLSLEARKEIIDRTDRGVFSLDTIGVLDHARYVTPVTLDVKRIELLSKPSPREAPVKLVGITGDREVAIPTDFLIVAIGFDAWWFQQLLSDPWRGRLEEFRQTYSEDVKNAIEPADENDIQHDLTIPTQVIPARLHVPMIANYARGPGFPNLSCLGLLADRILAPYVLAPC